MFETEYVGEIGYTEIWADLQEIENEYDGMKYAEIIDDLKLMDDVFTKPTEERITKIIERFYNGEDFREHDRIFAKYVYLTYFGKYAILVDGTEIKTPKLIGE